MLSSKKLKPYIFLGGIFFFSIFVIVIVISHFSTSVLAQGLVSPDPTGTGLATGSLIDTALNIINAALALAGVIAVSVLIYGGYVWMTSGGIPQRIALAKRILFSAAVGFFFILISWAIVNYVINGATGGGGGGPGGGGPGPLPGGGGSSSLMVKWTDPKDGDSNIPLCRIFQTGFNRNINTGTINNTNIIIKMSCDGTHPCNGVFGGQDLGACTDFYGTLDYCTGNIAALPTVGPGNWNYFDTLNNDGTGPALPDAFEFSPPTEWEADRTYWVRLSAGITNLAGDLNLSGKTDYVFSVGNTTDNTPPTVANIYPNDGDINVCRLKPISVQFSEPMRVSSLKDLATLSVSDNDYASLEISLNDGSIQPADLTFGASIPDPVSAVYAPQKPYEKNTTYYPILRSGEDADGNKKVEGAEDINGNGKPDGIQDACGNFLDQTAGAPYGSPWGDYGDAQGDPDDAPVDHSFTTDNADDIQCDPQIDLVTTSPFYYDPPNILTGNTGEMVIQGKNFGATGEVNLPNGIVINNTTNSCLDQTIASPNEYTDTGRLCRVSWADNQIVIIAPAEGGSSNGAVDGSILVNLGGTGVCDLGNTDQCLAGPNKGNLCFSNDDCPVNVSNAANIDIASPHISKMSPTAGSKGQWITLNGTDFGAASGIIRFIRRSDNTIVNGNFPCGSTGWTDTRIIVELPINALFNVGEALEIQIERSDGRHGNFGAFTVNTDPLGPGICSISRSCGEIGTTFNIEGKRFGTAGGNVVFRNDNTAAETLVAINPPDWGDDAIQDVAVPVGLPDAPYSIIARVAGFADSNPGSFDKPCPGLPCDLDTTFDGCQEDVDACDVLGPTYSCNTTTCRCDNNPLPKVVEQNSCILGTQSPSPYIGQIDACRNSWIMAKFNKDMDDATLTLTNVSVETCSDASCTISTPVDISTWIDAMVVWGDNGEEAFAFKPGIVTLLNPNTYYRATLKEVMTSAISLGGYHLDGNKNGSPDGPGPGPLDDDYSWIFKTSNDSCKVKSIVLSPANMSVAVSSSKPITAIPQAENCNAVISYASQWNWTSADASTATVSTNDNELLMGLIDPVQQVTGNKAGTTIVSASMPAEPAVPAGISNITVTNTLSCSDAGITAVWKFDEDSGPVALDSSTSGANDGILMNDPTRLSSGCKFGKCLSFDGMDDLVRIPSNPSIENITDSSFTIEAWVKLDSIPNGGVACAGPDFSACSYGVVIRPDSPYHLGLRYHRDQKFIATIWYSDNTSSELSSSVLSPGTWHHLLMTVDDAAKTFSFYVDGTLVAGSPLTYAKTLRDYGTARYNIGVATVSGNYKYFMDGSTDEARLWNKAMDVSEVKSIYSQACMPIDEISCSDPNLKAVWKLDENSGIVANDSTANNNDGQLNNNPTWKTGAINCKFGSCLEFDGSDDYIKVDDVPAINGKITVEGWVRLDAAGKNQRIVMAPSQFTLRISDSNTIHFADTLGNNIATPDVIANNYMQIGKWHHIAGVFFGNSGDPITTSNAQIYIDGVPRGNWATGNWNSGAAGSVYIGSNAASAQFLDGAIDELRVWDKALTQDEIVSAMSQECNAGSAGKAAISCTNDVVGAWNFDKGNGTLAADSSRNRNNGAIMNGAAWNTTGCQFGSCLNFDGTDDYIDLANPSALNFGDGTNDKPFTFSAWVKRASTNTKDVILSKYYTFGVSNRSQYWFEVDDTGHLGIYLVSGNGDFRKGAETQNSLLNDTNWHHVAATYNGNKTVAGLRLYIDGIAAVIAPPPDPIDLAYTNAFDNPSYIAMGATTANFQIGRYTDSANSGENFDGTIDEVRIYSRALSAAEIANTYQKSMTQCVEATLMCSNPELTAVWKMDEGIGVVAGDSTANNLDGALGISSQNPAWIEAGCYIGKCLDFNAGEGDYVAVPDNPKLNFGINSFTIEGWVKYTATARERIISKYSANNGYDLVTDSGQIQFNVCEGGVCDSVTSGATSANTGGWVHIAAVRDRPASELRLYVGGWPQGTAADNGKSASYAGSLYLGREQDTPYYYFSGIMDEMRIWNKALSDNEVQSASNQQCLAPQKGSACDLDLAAPQCQPNVGLCESGDPDLRCSIESCTCQEAFMVSPPQPDPENDNPNFTRDSSTVNTDGNFFNDIACRNTAITVNFNEPIDASTIKTAKTTVKVIDPPILSESFDALPAWTEVNSLYSPHWPVANSGALTWNIGIINSSNALIETELTATNELFIRLAELPSITNYRISFEAGTASIGSDLVNALGFVWGFRDDKNYYQLLWEDPTDAYASGITSDGIFYPMPTRLRLQKMTDGIMTDLAIKDPFAAAAKQAVRFTIEVRGTNIFVSANGKSLISHNDSSAPAILPVRIGFYAYSSDGGVFYDNLTINEIAPTVAPGTVELIGFEPATGNLLADGDMERTDTDVWKTYNTPAVLEKTTSSKHGGSRSLRVTTDDGVNREGVYAFGGVVNGGDKVRVHTWCNVPGGSMNIWVTNDIAKPWAMVDTITEVSDPCTGSGWKELALDWWPTFNGAFYVAFISTPDNSNEFYLDDVFVAIERSLPVDISTSVSGSQLTISPRQFLDPNRNYNLILKGTNNAYVYSDVIKSINGTPLEQPGDYIWNGLTTGTEICKIGKAEIQFMKNSNAGPISYKGSDSFTCAGNACTDDMNTPTPPGLAGNQHAVEAMVYSINGGPLGGSMTYKWTKNTDAPFTVNPENIITLNDSSAEITAGLNNGAGTLYLDVDGGDAGTAKASANVTIALCENPWLGDLAGGGTTAQTSVPWKHDEPYGNSYDPDEIATNFSLWYCRDAGNMQDLTDDLPNLTVQRVTTSPGTPKPMAEYFYYDAGNPNDAIGVRVYKNLSRLPLSEWLDQNANVSGGQSGMFNGWQSVKAGRSLYVSAMNDMVLGIYNNIYLISYSDKSSSTLIGIYNQMISNWKFMVNGISDADIAKLQRDIRRIDDLGKIATALDSYKTANGSYPKLDAGTYLPGMSTSVWPSWQASFGNALQTGVPKDPINQLSNLMAYWKFDEGTGITTKDSSVHAYDGRMEGNVQWASESDCKVGRCLDFGSDPAGQKTNVVRVPREAMNGLNDFTTEFWLKAKLMANGGSVISGAYGTTGSQANELTWILNNGKITPAIKGAGYISSVVVGDDQWHHTAMSRENGVIRLYVDGVLKDTNSSLSSGPIIIDTDSTTADGDPIQGDGLVIGQEQDNVGGGFEEIDSFKGYLDDLRIWNRALSGSEIALLAGGGFSEATGWNQDANSFQCDAGADFDSHIYHYQYNNADSYNLYGSLEYVGSSTGNTWRQAGAPFNPCTNPSNCACYNYKVEPISCSGPNLKAVWKLDENSGIVANDSTANNNDGQLNNNPTWKSSADCKSGYGSCLSFDGNDDYIMAPDSASLSVSTAITMEAWIKTTEQIKQQYIFSKNTDPTNTEYTILLNPGGIIRPEFRNSAGIYQDAFGATNVADGSWHHIAATFDGSNIKIYNNGVLESTTPWVSDIRSTTAPDLFIGQRGDNSNQFFIGSIDEPRIWDKALTQEEIIAAMKQSCQ